MIRRMCTPHMNSADTRVRRISVGSRVTGIETIRRIEPMCVYSNGVLCLLRGWGTSKWGEHTLQTVGYMIAMWMRSNRCLLIASRSWWMMPNDWAKHLSKSNLIFSTRQRRNELLHTNKIVLFVRAIYSAALFPIHTPVNLNKYTIWVSTLGHALHSVARQTMRKTSMNSLVIYFFLLSTS